jgi:hypothetical protein
MCTNAGEIFCDLAKSSDCVNHKISLIKFPLTTNNLILADDIRVIISSITFDHFCATSNTVLSLMSKC